MKNTYFFLAMLGAINVSATIHLSYDKGTGGQTGVGRSEVSCSPEGCDNTSPCETGYGLCFNEGGHNDACPTYQTTSTACPGAGKIWLETLLTNDVQDVWDAVNVGVESGSDSKTYYNLATNETVITYIQWQPRSPGSQIIDITIIFG